MIITVPGFIKQLHRQTPLPYISHGTCMIDIQKYLACYPTWSNFMSGVSAYIVCHFAFLHDTINAMVSQTGRRKVTL